MRTPKIGHQKHQKQAFQPIFEHEHAYIDRDGAAEKAGEHQPAVRGLVGYVLGVLVFQPLDEQERIKIHRENVCDEKQIENQHIFSMHCFRKNKKESTRSMNMKKRALVSVSDKTGIVEFCQQAFGLRV